MRYSFYYLVTKLLAKISKFTPSVVKTIISPLIKKWVNFYSTKKYLKFNSLFIKPGCVVFDIGAYNGTFTEIYLKLKPKKIICVEPNPILAKVLEEKFRNNNRVTIIPAGVASQKGEGVLIVNTSNLAVSTFSNKWRNYQFNLTDNYETHQIPLITLDELIRRFGIPYFCKIDVEGFEVEVFRGLSSRIPFIAFEFTTRFMDDIRKSVELLLNLGNPLFNFSLTTQAQTKLFFKNWLTSDQIMEKLSELNLHHGEVRGDIYVKF